MSCILIVEDDSNNVEILERLLKVHQHEVVVANDKLTAIEKANEKSFDLILMDIEILDAPDGIQDKFGGLEVTRAIKQDSVNRNTPVIACTAQVMVDETRKILDAGCDELASKPYNFGELVKTIDKYLGDATN